MGRDDWQQARAKIDKASRALSDAQDRLSELFAMDPSPANKARFDRAFDFIERARWALYEVKPR